MHPSQPNGPPLAPESGSSPSQEYWSREQLCPALQDPEYIMSANTSRPMLRAARFHARHPGRSSVNMGSRRPLQLVSADRPLSASSTSCLLTNSSEENANTSDTTKNGKRHYTQQKTITIPINNKDNPTTTTATDVITNETSNVNNNPLTTVQNGEVAHEVGRDVEDCVATVVARAADEHDEVEMSLVCICHPCGSLCDLNDYQSYHLNECVPPRAKRIKINCICGKNFRVEKHLLVANGLCRHTHSINDRSTDDNDDDINRTIETFNGLVITDIEDERPCLNAAAVNLNMLTEIVVQNERLYLVTEEEEIVTTTAELCPQPIDEAVSGVQSTLNGNDANNSDLNENDYENQHANNNDTTEEIRVDISDEETSEDEHTYTMSHEGCEDEDPISNAANSEVIKVDDTVAPSDVDTADEEEEEDDDSQERYYRRLYDLVVASSKEKFGNSVAITPQDNIADSTDHSDHGNERQDHHKTELLATANNESSQTNEHNNSNDNAKPEVTVRNDDAVASHVDEFGTDLGGGSGTDHENGRQDHNEAELHASVNNESSQIMEHDAIASADNIEVTLTNDDEEAPHVGKFGTDHVNERQDYNELKIHAAENNASSHIIEHNPVANAANLDATVRDGNAVAPHVDEKGDGNADDENGEQDNDVQNAEIDLMCALYKFDYLNQRWICRGTGLLSIMYNMENNSWTLLFRRLVAPGEYRITRRMPIHPGLRLQQMKYNDRAWEWTYHYLTKDGRGEFENLGVRFKDEMSATKFHEKFNQVKKRLTDLRTYSTRCRFATSCPTWPPTREVSTPSDVASNFGSVSPTFNMSSLSPTFNVSPNEGNISPSDAMVPTFDATEHTAVQTETNDAPAAIPEAHFDINTPSISGTQQTLRTVRNNEEIVHELKKIKERQNETLEEVRKISSMIQCNDNNSEDNKATVVKDEENKNTEDLDARDKRDGVAKEEPREKDNDKNRGVLDERNKNNKTVKVSNGGTSGLAGALELRSETSSGNIKNVKENGHDGVRGQAKKEPGVRKGKENRNKSQSKRKSSKTTISIKTEPSDELNESPEVTDVSDSADKKMNSHNSNSNGNVTENKEQGTNDENKDESKEDNCNGTQEISNIATNVTDTTPDPNTSEMLSELCDLLKCINTAKSVKDNASCVEDDVNKDTKQPTQTAENTDETNNKAEEVSSENTIIDPEIDVLAKTTATNNNETNIDQSEEAERKDQEANSASTSLVAQNDLELAKVEDTLTEEIGNDIETNTKPVKLRPSQMIIRVIKLCARIIIYMFGLGIVALMTIFVIYFFQDIVQFFECLE